MLSSLSLISNILLNYFIHILILSKGSEAIFSMHGNLTLEGTFECSSADLKYFHASNLNTSIGKINSSILRSSDVISIEFKSSSQISACDEVLSKILSNLRHTE